MNLSFFIIMMFALQIFYWFVGKYSSKTILGMEDYFLAGKSVKLFPLTMTFLGTLVGGGVMLGAAEEAYRFGWAVILYPIGAALGLIVLGAGLGRKLAEFQVSTIAEIFEVVYQSKRLKEAASVLSIVSMFMILVGQIIASHKFLVSLGLNNTYLFLIFWAIVIFYTAQGGLRAVISTDMVQAAFFSVVLIACFLMISYSSGMGVFIPYPGAVTDVTPKMCGWLFMPLLFIVTEQDMGQRCFAAGSPQTVSRATLFAGLIMMVICVVPVFFGVLAMALNIEIPEGASVLMTTIEAMTSPKIAALVGCAVLAAIISTASSLINAISSNLFHDFALKSDMKQVRLITMCVSFAAIFFAFYFDNIIDMLVQSFELSVSCLFVPIVFALFNRKGYFPSALLAFLFGGCGFVLFRLIPSPIPREFSSILLSLAGFGLGFLMKTKQKNKEKII